MSIHYYYCNYYELLTVVQYIKGNIEVIVQGEGLGLDKLRLLPTSFWTCVDLYYLLLLILCFFFSNSIYIHSHYKGIKYKTLHKMKATVVNDISDHR